ncbi:hypothetical protein ACEZCY_27055 [Streptacidiphilus sp. N1-12]|uniref:Uncharacterized protein n=2 Tax=Streptacidiphilus alkalitolerans TaxID=3342712 RepID=A0ABV6VGD4_9ACTN
MQVVPAVLALLLPRRLPPRAATPALTGSALVAAGSWLGTLALLAFSGFGRHHQGDGIRGQALAGAIAAFLAGYIAV